MAQASGGARVQTGPAKTPLRRILDESPQARTRITRAVSALASAALVGFAAVGLLLAWHIRRRARRLQEGLAPPRIVRWPDLEPGPQEPLS
jgi:hypothetical protein